MKEAAMSIQKASEITGFIVIREDRRGVVVDNYSAMHSYGNTFVANQYPREVLEANIKSGETGRSQRAQSST